MPTSAETKASSKLSSTSSSTVLFPAMAFDILERKFSLVFCSPSSKLSFSFLPNSLSKKPMPCYDLRLTNLDSGFIQLFQNLIAPNEKLPQQVPQPSIRNLNPIISELKHPSLYPCAQSAL